MHWIERRSFWALGGVRVLERFHFDFLFQRYFTNGSIRIRNSWSSLAFDIPVHHLDHRISIFSHYHQSRMDLHDRIFSSLCLSHRSHQWSHFFPINLTHINSKCLHDVQTLFIYSNNLWFVLSTHWRLFESFEILSQSSSEICQRENLLQLSLLHSLVYYSLVISRQLSWSYLYSHSIQWNQWEIILFTM